MARQKNRSPDQQVRADEQCQGAHQKSAQLGHPAVRVVNGDESGRGVRQTKRWHQPKQAGHRHPNRVNAEPLRPEFARHVNLEQVRGGGGEDGAEEEDQRLPRYLANVSPELLRLQLRRRTLFLDGRTGRTLCQNLCRLRSYGLFVAVKG